MTKGAILGIILGILGLTWVAVYFDNQKEVKK